MFYNLHSEFMGGGERAPDGRPQHRLWSLTPNGSTVRQPAAAETPTAGNALQAQQAGGDAVLSPDRSVSLRINMPSRRGQPPAGPVSGRTEHEPQVTVRDLQQQEQEQQRSSPSVSFTLPRAGLGSPPASDGDEGEQEATDSNSAANSFSFLMGGACKLHDD